MDITRFFEPSNTSKGRKSLRAEAVRQLQIKWSSVHYLLIDEISTVSEQLFAEVSSQMVLAKNPADKTLPFGGINVIVCGDFMQFPPVTMQGKPLYYGAASQQLLEYSWGDVSESLNMGISGRALFMQLTDVVILKQQMRQANDTVYHFFVFFFFFFFF